MGNFWRPAANIYWQIFVRGVCTAGVAFNCCQSTLGLSVATSNDRKSRSRRDQSSTALPTLLPYFVMRRTRNAALQLRTSAREMAGLSI